MKIFVYKIYILIFVIINYIASVNGAENSHKKRRRASE